VHSAATLPYDKVIAKRMIDDCYYTYTCKDKYIYLYGGDLLERILVWARSYFSRKGHLGNHLSIGLRTDNSIDIHETIYEVDRTKTNELMIGKKKTLIHLISIISTSKDYSQNRYR
jgi:hypothetical protein